MELNQLNTGSLESLASGQVLLLRARKVKNGKIELEWAEKVKSTARTFNVLQLLNASDPNFSSGARRAWVSSEVEDILKTLGIDASDENPDWYIGNDSKGKEVELLDLDIINPAYTAANNITYYFKMQVIETTEPSVGQLKYAEENGIEEKKQAEWCGERFGKRAGKEGPYITHLGSFVFSNTTMELVDVNDPNTYVQHEFLAPDPKTVTLKEKEEEEVIDFEETVGQESMLDAVENLEE